MRNQPSLKCKIITNSSSESNALNPFEKYFYSHLKNVTLNLKELNESIQSRKNFLQGRQEAMKQVNVRGFGEEGGKQHIRRNRRYAELMKNNLKNMQQWFKVLFTLVLNNKKYIYLIILILMWIFGFCYFFNSNNTNHKQILQSKVTAFSEKEWKLLIREEFAKGYSASFHFNQDSSSFQTYCDIFLIHWLKQLNPFYGFLMSDFLSKNIEDCLISDCKVNHNSNGLENNIHTGIFNDNYSFISIQVIEIHRVDTGFISMQILVRHLAYNSQELQYLLQKYISNIHNNSHINHTNINNYRTTDLNNHDLKLQQNQVILSLFLNSIEVHSVIGDSNNI